MTAMDPSRQTIFITGGSGFIGRNLVEQFSDIYNVLAPDYREMDLTDEDAVRRFFTDNDIDFVIHCATKPGHRNAEDPTNLIYPNTRMFFNIVRNANRFNKMIFIGSGAVYDMRHYRPKMSEDYFDAHVPSDEHGYSKYVTSNFIKRSKNIVDLRIFGIFGKYEDYAIRFISNAICKTLYDLPITIKQNRRFDYIYIDDLPQVIKHFMHNETKHWAYNVAPDNSVELLSLANTVKEVSGKDLPIIVAEPGMGIEYSGDNTRLRSEMPNLRLTLIDEAISSLFSWYADNKEQIDRQCLLKDK